MLCLRKCGQGYINGQNLTIDCHEFGPNIELSSKIAVDLVKAHVDVIIAWGDVALRAAQQATLSRNDSNARGITIGPG